MGDPENKDEESISLWVISKTGTKILSTVYVGRELVTDY